MKYKALILFALLLTLCGCQLAREDLDGSTAAKDRLIGAFITTEHLDLFNTEAYLKDFVESGGQPKDDETYHQRLYATQQEKKAESGVMYEYVFDTVEGFSIFTPLVNDPANGEAYWHSSHDKQISNTRTAIAEGDTQKLTLEGTIYLTIGGGTSLCYVNPVYQTANGAVYTVQGHGYHVSGSEGEGVNYTTTLSESGKTTINGETTGWETNVTIAVEMMYLPTNIVVTQFDDANKVVAETSYVPEETPEALSPEKSTAYIVVQTEKSDRSGAPVVARTLLTRDDDGFNTFYDVDGICIAGYTVLDWK